MDTLAPCVLQARHWTLALHAANRLDDSHSTPPVLWIDCSHFRVSSLTQVHAMENEDVMLRVRLQRCIDAGHS
jgi:hypothetical protein